MPETLIQGTELAAHVAMGIGLAACAGLRAFLPLLVVGLAGRLELVPLSESFDWLAEWPALIVFSVAVVTELVGDKFPLVDHALDALQIVIKPTAGAFVMATVVSDWSPLYLTVVWVALGGGLAGLVHLGKAKLRLLSTGVTAGLGNPVLSLGEDAGALVGSVGAVTLPFIVAGMIVLVLVVAIGLAARGRKLGKLGVKT